MLASFQRQLKFTSKVIIFLMLSICCNAFASVDPLPPQQAFQFNVKMIDDKTAAAEWQIAPGYYLYAKRMQFKFSNANAVVNIPQGNFKYQNNQRFEILSGNVSVPITVQNPQSNVAMQVSYQGCSQNGFCYPPMTQQFILNFVNQTINTNIKTQTLLSHLLNDQNQIANFLQQSNLFFILLIFFALGILMAFTPCVLPMIPILTSIIAGQNNQNTKRAFTLSCMYVVGSAITYAIAGIFAGMLGHSLQIWLQTPLIISITSGFFILLSLSLFGLFELRMPAAWQTRLTTFSNQQTAGQYAGVFCMGFLSALIVSPCVTAPLVGVLMYIATTGNAALGAISLFMLGIGMGLPLILIGTSAGRWLPKAGRWMQFVKQCFGFMMLGMAIWLMSRVLSGQIIYLMYAIFSGCLFIWLIARSKWFNNYHWFRHVIALGFSLLALSFAIIFYPNKAVSTTENFTVVRNIEQLNAALLLAKTQKQSVILDFYADWCESCVAMDKKVFEKQEVRAALKNYLLLRADLSNNDAPEEALLKQYGVIAPPTVLFFNADGHELNSKRIIGEVDDKEFLNRLNQL